MHANCTLCSEWWVRAHDEKDLEIDPFDKNANGKFEVLVEKYVQISQRLKQNGVF